MVHQKRLRNQSMWTAVKAPAETNNTYDSEPKKTGMRRTYSEDTDLSETGKVSSNSSGDESWSDASPCSGKTKLSGGAGLFVPQQSMQGPGEQRTKLSSGASVFVPGQMASQQAPPAYNPQTSQAPPMFMPQMMPMDQGMPYMAPCYYMAADGCYYMVQDASMMCPIGMPMMSGAAMPLAPLAPQEPTEDPMAEPAKEIIKPSTVKDPNFIGKAAANASGKSRWADLDDDDDADDPWLQ